MQHAALNRTPHIQLQMLGGTPGHKKSETRLKEETPSHCKTFGVDPPHISLNQV